MKHLGAEKGELGGFGKRQVRDDCAPLTTRGSAVSMPSTSVQIWISRACSAAPSPSLKGPSPHAQGRRHALLRGADEPAEHRDLSAIEYGSHLALGRAASHTCSGVAAGCPSSVTSALRASTHCTATPAWRNATDTIRLDMSSPAATTRSAPRGVISRRTATDRRTALSSSHCSEMAGSTSDTSAGAPRNSSATASRCRVSMIETRAWISSTCPLRANWHASSSSSVMPDIAETTTTVGPCTAASFTKRTTRPIAVASATDVPPNFMTSGRISRPPASRPRASTRR